MSDGGKPKRLLIGVLVGAVFASGCDAATARAPALSAQEALTPDELASLVERISEPGGFFDTDNLISNETGYLNVMDALSVRAPEGGAYVGVGPDQNFSYVAEVRPEVAFMVDVRRDNLLHHLLLKALVERSPTRVEFLSALHGVAPPESPAEWRDRTVAEVVAWVDSAWTARGVSARPEDEPTPGQAVTDRAGGGSDPGALAQDSVLATVARYAIPLTEEDLATIRRFHDAFVMAGPDLRFNSFGRAPRPYYPTYRQLVTETDVDGDRVSYLASAERYDVVRALHLANRIVPVVGDLAGPHALREMGEVMREMGVELTAFYASNVEFYLWRDRTLDAWLDNLRSLPAHPDAVLIRSYFSNFGRGHPSAVRGYYATQIIQPVSTLVDGRFDSYWDLVTRDAIPLR